MTNPAAIALAGTALLVAIHSGPSPRAIEQGLLKLTHAQAHNRGGRGRGGGGGKGGGGGGPALITLKGMVENRVIGPLNVVGPYRIVESSKDLVLRNLRIQGVTGTDLQRDGIRIRGDAAGVTIQNFKLAMRNQQQVSPNLPTGIALSSGSGITISDGEVSGFQMVKVPGKYTNGDGIASERAVHDLTITRVVSRDNSDGGFDLKSSPTKLDQLRSENNGRNYRLWSVVEAGTLTSINPRGAHIWAAKSAKVHIKRLVAQSSSQAPLVEVERSGQVIIDSCDLRLPPGTRLVVKSNEGRVSLGRGCSVPR
ncbi:MAG: hypothetical protein ABIO69_06845 [Sphingomicrobium sp.]